MFLLLAIACPTEGDPPPPRDDDTSGLVDSAEPCGPLRLDVGNGATAHEPIDDGATVVMVHGVQGGWHITVSGDVSGIGSRVVVHATVTRISDGLVLAGEQQPVTHALDPIPGQCGGTWSGLKALLDDVDPGMAYQDFICSLVGERLRIEVDVTDLDAPSRVAVGVKEVVAAPWPDDRC